MDEYESLNHARWECKYDIVFIPKCRRKTLYLELRKHLGEVFRKLATQKESKIEEGHLLPDHVHMMIAIPPKYAEICGVPGDRIHQGQECNTLGTGLRREEAEFRRSALLGSGVFRVHRWAKRRGDPGIHQGPGKRGQPPGPDEPVALTGHL